MKKKPKAKAVRHSRIAKDPKLGLPTCKRCKRRAPVCMQRHICLRCEEAE